ncbi:DNA-binding MarR family transcriptional regulator [Microbacterium endophyticum]|uniref:DNA-binding MarR family transcriptional regulator n=1 Tax=Microbacterium endophyticum TaxID=1526412 RepID=A0A7W4YM73_9MICO|nr:MarR family transcriptional regulator [Microbacterium endophyticum]MBB2975219.1 DNA-binding MarR family transcriptional regulator [Microbacterium endophyticum]NIK37569.1 DNA-binding MarR family transcriptional regulator [Microbacterium endophyticum]
MAELLNRDERIAIARLHALLELLPTALDKELAPAGLTSFEYTLVEVLAEAPAHRMRLSMLAAKTNATLPRLSRVVSSLERKGLVVRAPCSQDGRATNAVLTPGGIDAFNASRELYAKAARAMILDGLATLPDDGVAQLAELSYAILSTLDPDKRLPVTADGAPSCGADPA